jgi:hypothetical protein
MSLEPSELRESQPSEQPSVDYFVMQDSLLVYRHSVDTLDVAELVAALRALGLEASVEYDSPCG